jgi:hypothetical protein
MRAKVVVLHTPGTRRIRSGYAPPEAGEIPCILKFDGVGDARTHAHLQAPAPYNRRLTLDDGRIAFRRLVRGVRFDVRLPLVQLVRERVNDFPVASAHPMHWEAANLLPPLDGPHPLAEVRGDFLPAIQSTSIWRMVVFGGHGRRAVPLRLPGRSLAAPSASDKKRKGRQDRCPGGQGMTVKRRRPCRR